MKRYWDYSEKERASLTSEQVESTLAAELMEAGVVRVESPTLLPVETPELPKQFLFVLKCGYGSPSVGFRTADDAARAMELAVGIDHEYLGGNSYYHASGKKEITIEKMELYTLADITNARSAAEQAAANKKANEALLTAYREACKSVDTVCDGVWDDWHRCRNLESRYRRIIDTRNEYATICDGDTSKADVFLAKAFPQPDIEAALDWFATKQESVSA